MNKVFIIGEVVRAELKYGASGVAVTKGIVKTKKYDREGKETKGFNFIPFTAFKELALIIGDNVTKGDTIAILGEYTSGSYEGKDGKKVYTTEVIVGAVEPGTRALELQREFAIYLMPKQDEVKKGW